MKKNNTHFQFPKTVKTPDRFRNPIGKYTIRRNARCVSCGLCAELCPYGVHPRYDDYAKPLRPLQALTLRRNPILDTLGDYRWTAEMLIGHWEMAETGNLPVADLEYSLGNSGGGFDKIRFKMPDPDDYLNLTDTDMDTSVTLNKRGDDRPVQMNSIPCYGGGMSYGSTALSVMISRAQAATLLNTLTCTGEGGYPDELIPYADHVITQIATGLFGVREETILHAPMVEFKYAQGAKPGLGGHLLGDKVTPEVAAMRETVVGNALFSPFPFHSVYSVEDHKKHVFRFTASILWKITKNMLTGSKRSTQKRWFPLKSPHPRTWTW